MFKQSASNLLEQSPEKVKKWLDSFDSVITDCDGVLWVYSNVIEGSVEVLCRFQELGKKVYFCTNNSTKTRRELCEKACQMGYDIDESAIISTAHSAAGYLKNRNFKKRVYVIGMTGITQELSAVGIEHTEVGPDVMSQSLAQYLTQDFRLEENVGAVMVGFDENFSFPKMTKAASYLSNPECLFIATNTDERFPMPNLVVPGTGSFVRAVQTCAEREPLVIGKPNPTICEHLIKSGEIKPERTLMIGDRCNTDILLGYNCGFQTLLVGTGIHQLNDVATWQQSNDAELLKLTPDVFLPKLGDLLQFMSKDCVLWHDNVAIPGSPETINMLKKQGKNVYFATSNGTKTRHELWLRAIALGFDVAEEDIKCPTHLIAEYLRNRQFKQKVYVIGSGAIVKELEAVGIECFGSGPDNLNGRMNRYIEREIAGLDAGEVGAVVVGFDEHFSYGKMLKSCNYLTANPDCLFLATNTDGVHKYPMYHIPGTGAILKAIEACSGRDSLLFGKPNPTVVEALVREGMVVPERTLGIGDCCKIDVTFGRNCGFQTLLVGTGNYQLADVKKLMENPTENHQIIPDTFLPKLGDLLQYYSN